MSSRASLLRGRFFAFLHLVRYRFLVVAGLLPYLVGSAAAFRHAGAWHPKLFLLGLAGIGSALVAVEAFNEYFDSLTGNDFVFSPAPREPLSVSVFWMGVGALLLAAGTGAVLSVLRDGWVMAFAAAGGVGVVFYVGPPLRLAYRGLGEAVIAACYGPLMILGAFYLHAGRITAAPVLLSVPVAALMLALVLANEVPDYYQDKLVGKRNLVVRLGRRRAVRLYGGLLGLFYVSLAASILSGAVPMLCLVLLASVPVAPGLYGRAVRFAEEAPRFIPVIRGTLLLYCGAMAAMGLGYLLSL